MRRFLPLLVLLMLSLLIGCSSESDEASGDSVVLQTRLFAMDTVVDLTVVAPDEATARRAIDEAARTIQSIQVWGSADDPASETAQINAVAEGYSGSVSEDFVATLRIALDVAVSTAGAFDPTIRPLVELWNFSGESSTVPPAEELAELLPLVNYRQVELVDDKLTLPAGYRLDLGAVAKGYIVDLALQVMEENGATAGLVSAGGDVAGFGERPTGGAWIIGIQHPRLPEQLFGALPLNNAAVATSGDYERYFELDGVRYHHLLDPATGSPARGLTSVTVLAPTCAEADAWATAVFVLGLEAGLALLEEQSELEGLLLYEVEGQLQQLMTAGFSDKLELIE